MAGKYKAYPEYKDSGIEWLENIPATWATSYLGFECSVKARLGWKGLKADEYVDEGYVFLATPNIKDSEIDFVNVNRITKERYVESPEIMLNKGDVLVTKDGSTTGTTNIVRYLPEPATVNSSIAVLRSFGELESSYLYYFFVSDYTQNIINRMRGGMGVPHLFQADLRKFNVLLPAKIEQQKIANFLDHETAKIDTLIEEQQSLIRLLQEKRQAVISHAVTKGLNPDAPMKDSGVEWLGEVPEHWSTARVKQITGFITSGPRGWSDYLNDNGTATFLQSGDLNNQLQILPEKAKKVSPPANAQGVRTKLEEGDVVVCITGANTGRVAVVESLSETTYINQHLSLIRPLIQLMDSQFLAYCLASQAGREYFNVTQYGLKEGLSLSNVAEAPIAQPPIEDQKSIVEFLKVKLKKFDLIQQKTKSMIETLQERRTALISAAVTGKIDVREWSAPEPTAKQKQQTPEAAV